MMKRLLILLIIISCITSCFIGGGTHGQIESYQLPHSNDEIATIVDQFLVSNPEYFQSVSEDFGWIYIKIPPENITFGFSIGGQSEISLIAAGRDNEETRWNKGLSSSDKKEFTALFKTQFIDKLTAAPKTERIIKKPFVLTVNGEANLDMRPHYVFVTDTLLKYPLPEEFDSLGIDYFEDLVTSFAKNSNQEFTANQFHNVFRINKDYSGYLGDSIYINTFYRTIGQPNKVSCIFSSPEWSQYTADENKNQRIKDYITIRKGKTDKGYAETDVYDDVFEERWMIDNKHLKRTANSK